MQTKVIFFFIYIYLTAFNYDLHVSGAWVLWMKLELTCFLIFFVFPSVTRPQWCDVCRTEYSSSPSPHLSSTLHQFSLRHPPPTPHYCLPPSSNSYRMMVRCGWKPGAGLGPEGEGRKQPVSTVLKRDQKGLGYGPDKRARARVTHFQARDQDAVKLPCKEKERRGGKAQRQEAKIKEQKDKIWERDFRTSFYLWQTLLSSFKKIKDILCGFFLLRAMNVLNYSDRTDWKRVVKSVT